MPDNKLDILVLLRETNDPRPPARVTARGATISERGLRRIPNPADLAALEEALCLKDTLGASVTVLAIGPERLDDTLRLAFSMGADRAIRFWDHGLEGGDAVADARVLARIVTILSPTLVLTGNRLADRGDDPVPALAAAATVMPCITAAVSLVARQRDGWKYSANPTVVHGRLSMPLYPVRFSSRRFALRAIHPLMRLPTR